MHLGQLKDGRLLGVEVKRPNGALVSDERAHFLALVRAAGGVAFVAKDCRDVFRKLGRRGKENQAVQYPGTLRACSPYMTQLPTSLPSSTKV